MTAAGGTAIRFGVRRDLPYAAERVWRVMGNFSRLPDWFPGIGEFASEGNHAGAKRRILIPPFPAVTHELEVQDDAAMFTAYRVIDGPGLSPATGFRVTIRLEACGADACRVDWQATLAEAPAGVPAGAEAAFAARTEQNYARALDHFVARLATGEA